MYSFKLCINILFDIQATSNGISNLFSSHRNSFHKRASEPVTSLSLIISVPHSPRSHCISILSIPCGWQSSREAHFLILELPGPQWVTGPERPIRAQLTQPPSCLQEVDNKPFVFGFYKRKFCGGLPGRSDGADTLPISTAFHSLTDTETYGSTRPDVKTYIYCV